MSLTGIAMSTATPLPAEREALPLVVEPDTESIKEMIHWCEREAIRLAPLVECEGASENHIFTFLVNTFFENLDREPDRFYSMRFSTTPGAHHLLKATFQIGDIHRFELTEIALKHYSSRRRHIRSLMS